MRKRNLVNQINVVPYVDVMLVLLVIFMVTAPLVNPGVVDLPTLGKSANPPTALLEVLVKSDATLMLRERTPGRAVEASKERSVTQRELAALLRDRQAKNPDQPVMIAADKDVRYEAVLEVMDMLQQNQVRKVGLLAKPRS